MKRTRLNRWGWLLLFIPLMPAACLTASAQAPTALSLTEAIRIALEKNPTISAASSQIEASEAKIVQARSGLIPQLDFREAYSRTTNPMWAFGTRLNQEAITLQDFNPDRLNNPDPIDNFASTFSINWALYDSGRTWHGLRQARLARETVTRAVDRTRQQVIAQTVVAYAGLLLSQRNFSTIEQTIATARSHLKMVESRFASGFVVKSDLLRARVHIADLEQQQLQADSRIQIARAYLNSIMGMPIDSHFEPTSPLKTGRVIDGPVQKWLDLALQRRPDLEQLNIQEEIAQEEIEKSKSARYPSLNLVGNYEFNTENFSSWGENYNVGAVLNFNLYTGHRLSAGTAHAKALLRKLQAEKKNIENGILVQTKQAFLEARSAQKRIRVAQAAVVQAEEALRIVRNRYDSGLFTIVDLLDAELALHRARTNHFRSVHDHKVAAAQLALAAGTIDEQNEYP